MKVYIVVCAAFVHMYAHVDMVQNHSYHGNKVMCPNTISYIVRLLHNTEVYIPEWCVR